MTVRAARRAALGCALVAGLAACGGSSGPSADVLAELDAVARGPNRALAISTALVAPGTLLLSAPDDNLLNSINMRLGTETSQCAQRMQVPGTLTVSLDGPTGTGCALATGGVTAKGTMTITIARDGTTVRVLDMVDLTVEDEPLTGEIAIVTTDGNQFTYLTLAALSGHTFNIPSFSTMPINSTTVITADGMAPGAGTAMREIVYTGLQQRFNACHAEKGSVQIVSAQEGIDRTVTYEDDTPQTGTVTYLDSGATSTATLPHLSSCPPPPAGS